MSIGCIEKHGHAGYGGCQRVLDSSRVCSIVLRPDTVHSDPGLFGQPRIHNVSHPSHGGASTAVRRCFGLCWCGVISTVLGFACHVACIPAAAYSPLSTNLFLVQAMTEDCDRWAVHMDGLARISDIRGGLEGLRDDIPLLSGTTYIPRMILTASHPQRPSPT